MPTKGKSAYPVTCGIPEPTTMKLPHLRPQYAGWEMPALCRAQKTWRQRKQLQHFLGRAGWFETFALDEAKHEYTPVMIIPAEWGQNVAAAWARRKRLERMLVLPVIKYAL